MKKALVIISILTCLISCHKKRDYFNESITLLSQINSEVNDSSCIFLIHSYGAYMQPMVTKDGFEKELSPFFGNKVWDQIKKQRDLSRDFENEILTASNQIPFAEFNSFLRKSKNKNEPFWDQLVERYSCVSGMSIPIFSENFEYAFVYEYAMYGRLNGGGSCRVYRKEGQKWILEKTFNEWIS